MAVCSSVEDVTGGLIRDPHQGIVRRGFELVTKSVRLRQTIELLAGSQAREYLILRTDASSEEIQQGALSRKLQPPDAGDVIGVVLGSGETNARSAVARPDTNPSRR
jgi:hypothetical protein